MDIKFQFDLLAQEELAALKGGTAGVLFEKEQTSESGDGAKYVCCIEIGFSKKQISNP